MRPRGTLTLIWRADGLDFVLETLRGAFGGITILPIHAAESEKAIRILVRAVKDSRAPLALLRGFVLADAQARQTEAADAILRGGEALNVLSEARPNGGNAPGRRKRSA